MNELIDTTEMYLRTVYELVEEGIAPLRARIAERLHQSGPTVSQTVARMERDGLLTVQDNRQIALSEKGTEMAVAVMRKHRLAERLLVDVIGLGWEQAHDEACRWEHVISDDVEQRLVAILDDPRESPYGNPIPGLGVKGGLQDDQAFRRGLQPLSELVGETATTVVLRRMSEHAQTDPRTLEVLSRAGILPGVTFTARTEAGLLWLDHDGETVEIPLEVAEGLFVGRP
ncbi:metal-dependent transcriptional regulator [Luteococcus sp.]|uniref:metal-dependent transcriptional regulator n=1 Tax=Luteococcus sp. TaxID=1969402 RepID=UPI00373673C3